MKKYTALLDEIESEGEPLGLFFYAAITFISIGITLTVLDLIFGAERVTEVIASFF
jgi:hypothetical protein